MEMDETTACIGARHLKNTQIECRRAHPSPRKGEPCEAPAGGGVNVGIRTPLTIPIMESAPDDSRGLIFVRGDADGIGCAENTCTTPVNVMHITTVDTVESCRTWRYRKTKCFDALGARNYGNASHIDDLGTWRYLKAPSPLGTFAKEIIFRTHDRNMFLAKCEWWV